MRKRDLWVDFNDVGPDSRVHTLMKFASKNAQIAVGSTIIVGDNEGNRCQAQVIGLEGSIVELAVDGNTFRAGEGLRRPASIKS